MITGKYLYISGIIRNIYYYEPSIIGKLTRLLFWIHPKTTVIHPSNRDLLSFLNKDEAKHFLDKVPTIIEKIQLYQSNQKLINRYYRLKLMISSSKISIKRKQLLEKELATIDKNKIIDVKIPRKHFRNILNCYDSLQEIVKFPELWDAFKFAKYYTKSYSFNGRLLSYREIIHPKNVKHKYSDCVETFFRNLCIVANIRPNNFTNLKEDTAEDHIIWINWLLTIPNFEYVEYPEIRSCRKNLDIFLKYNNISMEKVGFIEKDDGWYLSNSMYTVEAYLIDSHASMKTTYNSLKSTPIREIYTIYLHPTYKNFLSIENPGRAARFLAYKEHSNKMIDICCQFIITHIDKLIPFVTPKMSNIYKYILNLQINLLGVKYFKKKHEKYYNQIQDTLSKLKY